MQRIYQKLKKSRMMNNNLSKRPVLFNMRSERSRRSWLNVTVELKLNYCFVVCPTQSGQSQLICGR